ncbi:hypothetical protein PCE1_000554 [Barthelona sp. PCE]
MEAVQSDDKYEIEHQALFGLRQCLLEHKHDLNQSKTKVKTLEAENKKLSDSLDWFARALIQLKFLSSGQVKEHTALYTKLMMGSPNQAALSTEVGEAIQAVKNLVSDIDNLFDFDRIATALGNYEVDKRQQHTIIQISKRVQGQKQEIMSLQTENKKIIRQLETKEVVERVPQNTINVFKTEDYSNLKEEHERLQHQLNEKNKMFAAFIHTEKFLQTKKLLNGEFFEQEHKGDREREQNLMIKELKSQNDVLESELKQKDAEIDLMREVFDEKVKNLNATINERISTLKSEALKLISSHKKEQSNKGMEAIPENDLSLDMEKEVSNITAQYEAINVQVKELSKQFTMMCKLRRVEGEDGLLNELDEVSEIYETNAQEMLRLNNRLLQSENKLKSILENYTKLETEKIDLAKANSELHEELVGKNQLIEELKLRLDNTQNKFKKKVEHYDALKTKQERNSKHIKQFEKLFQKSEAKINSLKSELKISESKNKTFNERFDVLTQEMMQITTERENFREKISRLESILRHKGIDPDSVTTVDENTQRALDTLTHMVRCSLCDYKNEKNVVLSNCGHCFCRQCVATLRSKRSRTCPTCNTEFTQTQIKSIFLQ